MSRHRQSSAYAPASVGNVGVGYDTLGHALDFAGDTVTIRAATTGGVSLGRVSGMVRNLPERAEENTAMRPLLAMRADHGRDDGVVVDIAKGIPLGSGMGGSAASAVAAVVAADAYWELGLEKSELLGYALVGEAAASGAAHADNAAPSLFGGLVFCEGGNPPIATCLPAPDGVRCVLAHPDVTLETRAGRKLLRPELSLDAYVRQSQYLAGFVAGCLRRDLAQIARCLRDDVVEPQRSPLIPGFDEAQRAAAAAGALGCSISGSGPSVFAWCLAEDAAGVQAGLDRAFRNAGLACETWVSRIDAPGARILPRG